MEAAAKINACLCRPSPYRETGVGVLNPAPLYKAAQVSWSLPVLLPTEEARWWGDCCLFTLLDIQFHWTSLWILHSMMNCFQVGLLWVSSHRFFSLWDSNWSFAVPTPFGPKWSCSKKKWQLVFLFFFKADHLAYFKQADVCHRNSDRRYILLDKACANQDLVLSLDVFYPADKKGPSRAGKTLLQILVWLRNKHLFSLHFLCQL